MITARRAATCAAILFVVAAPRLHAQLGSVRFTLSGGAHAGSYELKAAQCDILGGRGQPIALISMFTRHGKQDRLDETGKDPVRLELYTEGSAGADALALDVVFPPATGSRKQVKYEVYTIPGALQAGGTKKERDGSGVAQVTETATGFSATFRTQTKAGVKIEGSLECSPKRED